MAYVPRSTRHYRKLSFCRMPHCNSRNTHGSFLPSATHGKAGRQLVTMAKPACRGFFIGHAVKTFAVCNAGTRYILFKKLKKNSDWPATVTTTPSQPPCGCSRRRHHHCTWRPPHHDSSATTARRRRRPPPRHRHCTPPQHHHHHATTRRHHHHATATALPHLRHVSSVDLAAL